MKLKNVVGKEKINNRKCFVLFILFLIFLNFSSAQISINGTVKDFYGNVENAEVKVYDLTASTCDNETCPLYVLHTDANGKFKFYVNATSYDKTYNITVKKENYNTKTIQITINENSSNQTLEIYIEGIANVSGFLMDKDSGMAVKNARITILDKGTTTNEGGEFKIENLPAETVSIKIQHDNYGTINFVYDLHPGRNFIKLEISKQYTTKDYAVNVFTNYPSLIFSAGDTKRFRVNIKNIGTNDATYKLKIKDIDKKLRYRILNDMNEEINEIFVRSGETSTIFIEVKTPEDIEKGDYKFNLSVGSDEIKQEITLIVRVSEESTGSYGFEVSSPVRGKTVNAGDNVDFKISIRNNASNDIYKLGASVPKGWKYYVTDMSGSEITEVEVTKGSELNINFRVQPPSDEEEGEYELKLIIESLKGKETKTVSFRVKVRQEKKLYEVEISSPYSKKSTNVGESVEYSISISNKGRKDDNYNLIVENLPSGWTYKFKESSGNAPQISSVSINSGSTKNVVLQINPSSSAEMAEYPFVVKVIGNSNATLNLSLEIKGSYGMKLQIDSLWIQTEAGKTIQSIVRVRNTGLSELKDIELDVTKPQGFEVTVSPAKIVALSPGTTGIFTLSITPSVDTPASDYMINIIGKSQEVETSESSIRVTVTTPGFSGWFGLILIGVAIIILIIIFKKFGRR
ncbi:MAG: NEW3 domain-containing protein [Candidatus Altarchaeaceae archaeon]